VFIPIHTRLILGWVATGYSPEQAIEALIFGEHAFPLGQDCILILAANGDAVEPMGDRSPGNDCIDKLIDFNELGSGPAQQPAAVEDEDEPPAPGEAAGEIAGFYAGTLTLVQCGATCDELTCEIVRPWRLAVNADGSVRGSTPAQSRWTRSECLEPLEVGWSVEGTWDSSDGVRAVITAQVESFVDAPAQLIGLIEDGEIVLSLDFDPREGMLGSILDFNAVMTPE
jgi:hypothetical protein